MVCRIGRPLARRVPCGSSPRPRLPSSPSRLQRCFWRRVALSLPDQPDGAARGPALIDLQPGAISYRAAGDFTRGGKPAEAPIVAIRLERPLAIMRHQVTAGDYQRCVLAAACQPLAADVAVSDELPAVKVSWRDADAYAAWLSRGTGQHYRLPTDEEWAFAAGSRYRDDGVAVDANNPAKRWLARFEREAARQESTNRCRTPADRKFRRERTRPARSRGKRLGVDGHLLRARGARPGRRRGRAGRTHELLRRARRRRRASRLCQRFHPRCPRRWLRSRPTAKQPWIPVGARARPPQRIPPMLALFERVRSALWSKIS